MRHIRRDIQLGRSSLPTEVYMRAHLAYPDAVAEKGLYCMAFFGHGRPRDLNHRETTSSVWRGLIRRCLREYINDTQRAAAAALAGE